MSRLPRDIEGDADAIANFMQLEKAFYKQVGANISAQRVAKGLRNEDLANALGRSTSVVGHWQIGKRYVSLYDLHRISQVLGVSLYDLLDGTQSAEDSGYAAGHRAGTAEALQTVMEVAQRLQKARQATASPDEIFEEIRP